MNIRLSIAVIKFSFCNYFAAQRCKWYKTPPPKCIILVWHILINFSTVFFGNSRYKHKKSVCRNEKEAHGKPCIGFFLNRKHCGRR